MSDSQQFYDAIMELRKTNEAIENKLKEAIDFVQQNRREQEEQSDR